MWKFEKNSKGYFYENDEKIAKIEYSGFAENPVITVTDKASNSIWRLIFKTLAYKGTYGKFYFQIFEEVSKISMGIVPYTGDDLKDHQNILSFICSFP